MRSPLLSLVLVAGCVDVGTSDQPASRGTTAAALQVCGGSIQAAIDAAPPGEVIELCAGVYHERLVVNGKHLELRGSGDPAATTIDGGGLGRVLEIQNGARVSIAGLTLRNGSTASIGGGISCSASTLRLHDSVIAANRATGGGGLATAGCALDVARTRFADNDAGAGRGGGALLTASSGQVVAILATGNRSEEGGGLATVDGTVELADSELRGNSAHRGGGLFLGHDGRVHGTQIVGNEGRWTGGGIYIDARSPLIDGNTIDQNTSANDGAGIYVHRGQATIRDNLVTGNVTGDDGGGVRLFESTARVERNVIEHNQAADSGGGVRVSHLPALFVDNIIRNNRAELGGGMDLDNDSSVVRGGVIAGNQAVWGGGISAQLFPWSGGTIDGVQILDNVASDAGGGMFVIDNYQPIAMQHLIVSGNRAGRGAGMYVRATDHTVVRSRFDRNIATGAGGAIHAAAGAPLEGTRPLIGTFDFLVLYGNSASTGAALWSDAGGIALTSSIVAQNVGTAVTASVAPAYRYNDTWPRSFSGMADPTGASGNLSADPAFVDPATGNFALRVGSPAIDAGDPAVLDADGSRADMGMFGGAGGAAPPPPPPPPPGESGVVLEADAHVMADQPTARFGAAAALVADTSPLAESYLRFRVTGASSVSQVRLQLTVTNGTGDAPALYAAASDWDESTVTWNTRPTRGGLIADLGAVAAGTVVEYDVTSLVTGDGVYTLALVPTSTDGFAAYAREGATAPRLIVTTATPAPGPGATAVLEADGYAAAATPTTSFGSAADLASDMSPLEEGYLRFRVSGVTGPVTARLRLRVTDATSDGPALYAAGNAWEESTLTWNTRPARTGGALGDHGAAAVGEVIEYDVSTVVAGDGVYTFALVATSSSGFAASSREGSAPPQLILTTQVAAPAPATAVIEADTYAAADAPGTSFGGATSLFADTSPLQETYLRFRVTGLTAPPTRARLRVQVTDATSDGPAVYAATSAWTESTVTWTTRPARSGGVIADLGAAALGQFVEYDVTAALTGDGAYTFALVPTSSSGFAIASRESSAPPQLILER